jgi:hypothetical protein
MKSDEKIKWSAKITRKTFGTIDVEVEASSKDEAESIVKEKLRDGEYDQDIVNAILSNVECEEDVVFDVVKSEISRFAKSDKDSFERFKDVVPKNKFEWEGSIVLYDAASEEFFSIAFGQGGNLDADDIDEGFDDYIMVERYELDGTKGSAFIMVDAVDKGYIDGSTDGLREVDGGQLLLKSKEWTDGDIRRFIAEALDFVGYGAANIDELYKYLVYIASDK